MMCKNADMVKICAGKVRKSVADLVTPGYYQGLIARIDLTNPQGRWELVVLATLLAARIDEAIAESTFTLLRDGRLLEYERVLRQEAADVARVSQILDAEYRAIIDRERKVTAIFANALLLQEYEGDLDLIYQKHIKNATKSKNEAENGLISALRQLQQINTRAFWICRSMAEAGIWTNLRPSCTAFYDRYVRCALQRLALLGDGITAAEAREMAWRHINELFLGDTTPLFRLGRYLCLPADLAACERQCELHNSCLYWQKYRVDI